MHIKMEGMEMNVWHKEISKDRIDDFHKKIDLESLWKTYEMKKKKNTQKNTYPKHQILQTIICD